jgi:hypothetical protein
MHPYPKGYSASLMAILSKKAISHWVKSALFAVRRVMAGKMSRPFYWVRSFLKARLSWGTRVFFYAKILQRLGVAPNTTKWTGSYTPLRFNQLSL